MKSFPIPVVALGAGTQPVDEAPEFMAFPTQMATFTAPPRPETADAAVVAGARAMLEDVLAQARAFTFNDDRLLEIDLTAVESTVVRYVSEALSEGEVAAIVRPGATSALSPGVAQIRIQETAFPAFWRVLYCDANGQVVRDLLEVGAVPNIVAEAALACSHSGVTLRPRTAGVMNAPPILAELAAASARFSAGGEGHIVNFTLLPVSPDDMQYLVDSLGVGAVTLLSRGYGNCRITSTALRHVWWVQYFNSMDQLILNTIEVARVPEVALASPDDFDDSLERLAEWIQTLE
jgi:hydrogenase-1 operon protein HyaF